MSSPQSSTANILLRALSEADYALLEPHFRHATLKVKEPLYERNQPIEQVYFPEGGVGSIVSEQEGGERVEVGMYGREGMSGASVVLGAGQSPHASMVQVGNLPALVIASERLLDACAESNALQRLLLRYVQSLNVQAALTAASNAHYALPERLARWLLMCHDRADGDQMELTHEFLSVMLAVRRSGVTVTLHTLESTGAIRSSRGMVTVRDRARLEEIAGDSYGEAEAEYRRLIGPFGRGRHGMAAVG
jgi:CRP-like cAMP-binding protein